MPTYYGNNIADLGLQADLNGRIWFNYPTLGTIDFDQVKIGIDVPQEIGNIEGVADQAPLYYPPAASGIGKTGCQVYSFGSGTAYEKSPLVSNPSARWLRGRESGLLLEAPALRRREQEQGGRAVRHGHGGRSG